MRSQQTPLIRTLIWFIKIAIVIAAACYIYQKIFHRNDLGNFPARIFSSFHARSSLFVGAFLLLFLNWGLEAGKWYLLLGKMMPVSFLRAWRSVLAGVTTGVFTPNRVGEFGGRVFDLEEGHRLEATLLSFAGGFIQLLITILLAVPVVFMTETGDWYLRNHIILAVCIAILCMGGLFVAWTYKKHLTPGLKPYLEMFQSYSVFLWLKIAGFSLLRYFVFSFQFFLLLRGFGVPVTIGQAIPAIVLIFFTTTVIPTFALSEIGVRGSVSVIFLGMYSDDPASILASSFMLWVINIAIPALAGSIFVLRLDPFRRKTQEE